MLTKRVGEVSPHVDDAGLYAHTNFIAEFLRSLRRRVVESLHDIYLGIRPHAHDLVAFVVAKMYKISSWFAREFLKFYNFIQGRKVLKNSGKTSIFIRDISRDKEEGGISGKSRAARI